MKKKRESHFIVVPSVKLWLDDVKSIISILQQYSNRIEVSDRENEYESIEDLIAEKGTHPKSLEIVSYSPHVSLRFDRKEFPVGTRLYAAAGSPEGEASFLKIRELLLNRKRWANYVFHIWLASILIILLVMIPRDAIRALFPDRTTRLAFVIIPIFGYTTISALLRLGSFYSITLSQRHEHESFFKRNGERILFLIIGAMIVVFVEWLARRFLP